MLTNAKIAVLRKVEFWANGRRRELQRELRNIKPEDRLYFADEINSFAEQLEEILADTSNPQQRNRKAIDLHGKLDRCSTQLETADLSDRQRASLKAALTKVIDSLLIEVFHINPKTIEEVREKV